MSARVLVVDDNLQLAANLAELLDDEGYTVVTASSAEEALIAAEEHQFDFVLSDIRMPGMDGVELITKLHERHPQATYLLMTAYASDALLSAAASLGFAGEVLEKPLVIEDLLARVLGPSRTRLLLVEDDEPLAEVLALKFRAHGYDVRVAHTLADARAAIAAGPPSLAIVDIVLPDGNGLALVQEMISTSGGPSAVPLILMSGIARFDGDELRRVAPGGVQFLTKPFAPDALMNALQRLRK